MVRVVPVSLPAWWPALLFSGVLLLQGCSLLPKKDASEGKPVAGLVRGDSTADTTKDNRNSDDKKDKADKRDAFTVDVRGPEAVRDYLKLHLEIQRYRELDDLGATEISRLMVAAEANARELLGTLGYFTPTLTLELNETPQGAKAPREIVITVSPGELTKVSNVQISYGGPIADDATAEAQRDSIRTAWALRAGQPFTQQAWDEAKTTALRSLTAKRFPTGNIEISRAEVDADRHEARLSVTYQSGPAYKFGPLVQIGTVEDEEKPRFASLRPGQSIYSISLEEALKLFEMPRLLGVDANGEEVSVGIGRFGPFARRGATYASLKKEDDPYTIDLARALFLIEEKEEIARNRVIKEWPGHAVQVLNGRFGPYISDGKLNGKIPKDREPASLSLEETLALLEDTGKPARKGFAAKKAPARKAAAKNAVAEKPAAKKVAKKAVAKKAVAKKAPARKAARPLSGGREEARPLLTAAKVVPGKKRVVKPAAREDAPF